MGVCGVHVHLRAHDLGAQVEGARYCWDDDVHAEGVTLIRAGDVRLACFDRVGVIPQASTSDHLPDLAIRRTIPRRGLRFLAQLYAAQPILYYWRQHHREPAELLVSVRAT